MSLAVISDHLGHRFIFTLIPAFVALAGFAILFAVHNNVHLQYAALFLAVAGTYSSMPVIVCWFSANCERLSCSADRVLIASSVGGHRRRAVGTGWQIGFGNSELFAMLRIDCHMADRACSRRDHRCVLFPRQRRPQVQDRLQYLPRVRVPGDSIVLHVLCPYQLSQPPTRPRRSGRR